MNVDGPVKSPCVAVCQINRATGICTGCRRTLSEIANWLQLSDDERRVIMDDLPNRKSAGHENRHP